MIVIQTLVTLLYAHLVAVDRAVGIDPGPVIVTGRFHHKGVSIPMRRRISVPPRLGIFPRELAPVRPKVAPYAVPFEELDKFVRKLNESVVTIVQVAGVAGRIALEQRVIPIFLVRKESKSQRRLSGGRPRLTPLLLPPSCH